MPARDLRAAAAAIVLTLSSAWPVAAQDAGRGYVFGLEQAYKAAPDPALKMLIADEYARLGDRDAALAALQVVEASGRIMSPPPQSHLWRYRDDAAFRTTLAALKARTPSTHRGVLALTLDRGFVSEGVAYDPVEQTYFFSDAQNGGVIAADKQGKTRDLARGLLPTLGLTVDAGRRALFAATNNDFQGAAPSNTALVRIKLPGGELESFEHPEGKAFNDVTLAPNGDAYVSDTATGAIYRLTAQGAKLEQWLAPGALNRPNGLAVDGAGRYLFVAQGRSLMRVDLRSKAVERLPRPEDLDTLGMDGLYFRDGALFGVQGVIVPGRILKMTLSPALDAITAYETLDMDHPAFDLATTGVIVDGSFLVLANAQIHRLMDPGSPSPTPAKPPILLRYDPR